MALGLTYNYEGDQYTWEEVTITIGLPDDDYIEVIIMMAIGSLDLLSGN